MTIRRYVLIFLTLFLATGFGKNLERLSRIILSNYELLDIHMDGLTAYITGGQSPYPRDFIIDENGFILMAKTECDPGTMINIIESILGDHVATDDKTMVIPGEIRVYPSYPNPFNSTVTMRFELFQSDQVSIRIFDINGRLQSIIMNEQIFNSGMHTYRWKAVKAGGTSLASGLYIIEITTTTFQHQQKILLIK